MPMINRLVVAAGVIVALALLSAVVVVSIMGGPYPPNYPEVALKWQLDDGVTCLVFKGYQNVTCYR